MLGKAKPSGILPRRVKLQSIWNETRMKDHLDNLRWQANAIQLLLASTQLSPEENIRRMEGIAQAASHFRDGSLFNDTGSTTDEVDFEFDNLLVNTAIYRRALQSHLRQSNSRRAGIREQLAIGTNVGEPTGIDSEAEDLIDLSSEYDLPLTDSLRQETPLTPTLALFRDMEESQRWEHKITPDGRIFYWNSLTNAETSPAFELSFSEESNAPQAPAASTMELQVADRTQKTPESQGLMRATATSQVSVMSSFTEAVTPLSSPSHDYGNWTKFQIALFNGVFTNLEDFLPYFLDLNQSYFPGLTSGNHPYKMKPLHFACLCKHEDPETRLAVIQWLLDRGASPDSRDSDGDTPMHYLAQCNDVPIATLLLQHGADINLKGVKEYTPLHQATHYGALEMVLFLLQNGASTIHRNDEGDTPMTTKFNAKGYDTPLLLRAQDHKFGIWLAIQSKPTGYS